jgi:hypothetical protein
MTEAEINSLDHIVNDEMDYWDFYLSDEGESFRQGLLLEILKRSSLRTAHSGAPSATRSGRYREYARNDLQLNLACPDISIQSFHLMYIPLTLTAILQGPITSPNNQIGHEIQIRARSTRIRRREPLNRSLALTGRTLPWICSSHETLPKRRLRQQRMHAKSLMVLNKRNLTLKKHLTIHLRAHSLMARLTRLWIKTKRSRFLGRKT